MSYCRPWMPWECALAILFALQQAALPADTPAQPWHAVIEAEDMRLEGDWRVIKGQEGYFPAAPNCWSANRLRGSKEATAAVATTKVLIPADGRYAVWVRYESPYGFDVPFTVSIRQDTAGSTVYTERFGDRADLKYFNGVWRVQGPWSYHNTDYVYEKGVADLRKGTALVTLSKQGAGRYTAARIIDLIYLTDDLTMQPGAELNAWDERGTNVMSFAQPAIMVNCRHPVFFRLRLDSTAPAPTRVVLAYRHGSGRLGPQRDLAFTTDGTLFERYALDNRRLELSAGRKRAEFPANELLPPGFDSGWAKAELSTFETATVTVRSGAGATVWVSRHADGRDAVKFDITTNPTPILVASGNSRIEDELFRGKPATTAEEVARYQTAQLDAYQVPGKPPFKFGNLITPRESLGAARWEFFKAAGGSGVYFQVPPDVYLPENAERLRVNRSMAYRALQNMIHKIEYMEGDLPRMRKAFEGVRADLDKAGVGDIPQTFKMIEESGPPPLSKLAQSKIISARFRDYLKSLGARPAELVGRAALADAVASGKTDDDALWPLVNLCAGTPQDAAENPKLFYHSKVFGSLVFADNCAAGVKLIEEIFPAGSRANSGASFPQIGHGVRRNWYDEFMLFRRRGMTSFGSEISWGLNGTPDYVGAQTESYEGAIGRGVAKYHDATLGPTHLLACKRYGYPADYVELSVYALASHGFRAVHYYLNANFTGLDHCKAMKKAGYAMGAIEDQLVGARVVPGKVALGWSETTLLWDQAVPTDSGYNRPGNLMYSLERHYLYLLLRHLQMPTDLVTDADIEEGRLKDYPVFVLVGDHMTQKAAAALRSWVEAGGILISGAGGGLWDEYNRPLGLLNDVYGIKGPRQYAQEQGREYVPGEAYSLNANDNRLEKTEQVLRAKLELVHAHPLDTITCGPYRLPVLGYRQSFTLAGGTAIGTFTAGSPAIVTNAFGKGKALIMGFLPGIGYLYQAFPLVPYGRGGEDLSSYLYPDCKPLVRDAMSSLMRSLWPAMGAPVVTSDPYVEANLMRQTKGACFVALVNYSGKPIQDLSVRIHAPDAGNARTVRATFGRATVRTEDPDLLVHVPLDKFEWLQLE